jgi:N-acetylmuramoyl-L-alanine amidase
VQVRISVVWVRAWWLAALAVVFFCLGVVIWYTLAPEPSLGITTMARSVADRVIVIDPGHGGPDGGCSGASGLLEKEVVLDVANRLGELLRQFGAVVIMTRESDTDLSGLAPGVGTLRQRKNLDLAKRIELGNNSHADAFLSIHANAFPQQRYFGAQTFFNPRQVPDSQRLAVLLQEELVRLTGHTQRQASDRINQRILNGLNCPAVTVEIGFLTNPREEQLLSTPKYRQQVAWSIFVGLCRYFAQAPEPVA